jgi:predicted RNase H-like HicB family nuclease
MAKASKKTTIYKFPVIIERDEDGIFAADCPDFQGCHTQGDTIEEVITNIRDAIELNLKILKEDKQDIPRMETVSMTSLEVSL